MGDNCEDDATAGWVRFRLELAGVGGLARSEGVKGVWRETRLRVSSGGGLISCTLLSTL